MTRALLSAAAFVTCLLVLSLSAAQAIETAMLVAPALPL